MDYEQLHKFYQLAISVCDPVEFQNRKKNLVYAMAEYILHKDKPAEVEDARQDRQDSETREEAEKGA